MSTRDLDFVDALYDAARDPRGLHDLINELEMTARQASCLDRLREDLADGASRRRAVQA